MSSPSGFAPRIVHALRQTPRGRRTVDDEPEAVEAADGEQQVAKLAALPR